MCSRKAAHSARLLVSLIALSACAKSKVRIDLDTPHRANQLLISFHGDVKDFTQILDMHDKSIQVESLNEDTLLLKLPEGSDLAAEAEKWAEHKAVEAVEANILYKLEERTPNDPYFSRLWGLEKRGQQQGMEGADIGAPGAWEFSQGSRRILVGIIDSGIDYNHPDLARNIWKNPGESGLDAAGRDKSSNQIDDDGNGLVDDWRGWDFQDNDNDPTDARNHGTHVAGIMGAVGNNGLGIAGVSWRISMVPIKVFNAEGESSTDVIIRGLDYATKLGVLATNNSWGGKTASTAMLAAIKRAEMKGILFVTSAGNDGLDNDSSPHYPSNYGLPNMIAVAATDRQDGLAAFSNYGASSVQIAAPGDSIYSTLPDNAYGLKSGTSMATPHVTGLLAVLAARYPSKLPSELRQILLESAAPLARLRLQVQHGRLDARAAVSGERPTPQE